MYNLRYPLQKNGNPIGGGTSVPAPIIISANNDIGGNTNQFQTSGTTTRTVNNLIDTNGVDTGISLTCTTNRSTLLGAGSSEVVPGNTDISLENSALQGSGIYSFPNNSGAALTFLIENLVPLAAYTIGWVSLRDKNNGQFARNISMVFNGGTPIIYDQAKRPQTVLETTGIIANASGEIVLVNTESNSDDVSSFMGMSILKE